MLWKCLCLADNQRNPLTPQVQLVSLCSGGDSNGWLDLSWKRRKKNDPNSLLEENFGYAKAGFLGLVR